jgi:hypothetical protein
MSRAVAGISCMRPVAPFSETARGLKFDSAAITAFSSGGATPWRSAAERMCSSHSYVRRSSGGGRPFSAIRWTPGLWYVGIRTRR